MALIMLASHPFDARPHFQDASGSLCVWLTQPAGLVVSLTQPTTGTGTMARIISERAYGRLARDLGPGEKASFLYDLTHMRGYETEARVVLTKWGLDIRKRVSRIVVVEPPEMHKIARMGIRAAAASLAVAGIDFRVEPGLDPTIRELGLQPGLPRGVS